MHTGNARNHIRAALRHSDAPLSKAEPKATEFKFLVTERIGLLSEITGAISRSHVAIRSINAKLPMVKINCGVLPKEKSEKIMEKLKKIKEIREASFRLV